MYRRKEIVSSLIVLLIASMALTFPIPAKAESSVAPTVWVRYSTHANRPTSGFNVSINEFDMSQNFTLELWVDMGDYHLWSWQAGIKFNPAVLEIVAYPIAYVTPLFAGQSPYIGTWRTPDEVNNTLGFATFFGQSLVSGASPVNGTGQLAWWKFHVKGYCNSTLDLTQAYNSSKPEYDMLCGVKLNDKTDGIVIIDPVNLIDGWFHNCELKPAPYPGIVDITCLTAQPVPVCSNFTVKVTYTPGFDGAAATPCKMLFVDYKDDGTIDQSAVPPTANALVEVVITNPVFPVYLAFHCNQSGVVPVRATAWNPGGPSAEAGYNATMQFSTDVVNVLQYEIPEKYLDVYTQWERAYGYTAGSVGKGPGGTADEYQPQELVILYGELIYGGDPVQDKLVAFEVFYPNGTEYLARTAYTNETGIATVSFRIPWPCGSAASGGADIFGNWTVYATAEMAKIKYEDNMTFSVHWIVELLSLEIDMQVKKCEKIHMNLTLINYAMTPRNAVITIVLYDDVDTPIGKIKLTYTDIAPGLNVTTCLEIHIPKWAYVGAGKAYANAYTALPSECGVPWCPEVPAAFTILKMTP